MIFNWFKKKFQKQNQIPENNQSFRLEGSFGYGSYKKWRVEIYQIGPVWRCVTHVGSELFIRESKDRDVAISKVVDAIEEFQKIHCEIKQKLTQFVSKSEDVKNDS